MRSVGLIAQNSAPPASCAVGPREPTSRLDAGYYSSEVKAPQVVPTATAGMSVWRRSSCRRYTLLTAHAIGLEGDSIDRGSGIGSVCWAHTTTLLSGGGCCAGYLVHCGFNGRGWGGMAGDKEVAHDPA